MSVGTFLTPIVAKSEPSSDPSRPWPPDDVARAAAQLAREFPNVTIAKVSAAVNSAALVVLPAEGHVRLMRTARELLRPSL